ncbi:MAG: hypothetical protein IPO65_13060 [Saprospiraceae bacterium]|nr:hypothetical protein [Saprospiraceae bacterium]
MYAMPLTDESTPYILSCTRPLNCFKNKYPYPNLNGRIGALLLHFPEMPEVKVTSATFERIVYNRKNQSYTKAIEIAKLLLLQYHPDLTGIQSCLP